MIRKSNSIEETFSLAREFSFYLNPGSVVILEGNIGAGKTSFVKGVGKALNISADIISPTFPIILEYKDKDITLIHMDLYRISSEEEFLIMGGEEFLYNEGIKFIEWSGIIKGLLPPDYIKVEINLISENTREFCISGV